MGICSSSEEDFMKGLFISTTLLAALGLAAGCADSSRSTTAPAVVVAAEQSGGSGSDSVATGGGGNGGGTPRTPAAGPVASIRLVFASQTLPLNYIGQVTAEGLNAAGAWTGNVAAAWSSSNPAVATVADTGGIYPKSLGTTTVTATFGGFTASGTLTVVAATGPVYPTQPVLAQFNLSGVVSGIVAGTDTSHTEPIANATITLYRVASAAGAALNPRVTVGTTTTDAVGGYAFPNVAAGTFQLVASAPSGSPYADGSTDFGSVTTAEAHVSLTLRPK
jgi:hypothetical protein